jgi:phosphoketolase
MTKIEKLDVILPGNKNGWIVIGPDGTHKNNQGRVVVYLNEKTAQGIANQLNK